MATEYQENSLGWWINDRRIELRMTWEKVAERSGLSTETLYRAAAGRRMRDTNKRALEEALYWQPGSINAIGRGEAPTKTAPPAPIIDDSGNFDPIAAVQALLEISTSLRENGADAEAEEAISNAAKVAIKFGVLDQVSRDITHASHPRR